MYKKVETILLVNRTFAILNTTIEYVVNTHINVRNVSIIQTLQEVKQRKHGGIIYFTYENSNNSELYNIICI